MITIKRFTSGLRVGIGMDWGREKIIFGFSGLKQFQPGIAQFTIRGGQGGAEYV